MIRQWLTRTIVLAGLTSLVMACDKQNRNALTTEPSPNVDAVEVAPNGSYVSLTGTVVDARDSNFLLDYGEGVITVEMDDWDMSEEGRVLMEDDRVIVYGVVDADFYQKRTVEAGSVYVENLGTQFYANSVDEEDYPVVAAVAAEPTVVLQGTVEEVRGKEFVLQTDGGLVDVNVEEMLYNPLDDEGFQKLEKGDRVSVTGEFGVELFEDLDLKARTVVTLRPKKGAS